jgi:choline dehydrogenase-like flavoprotein
MEMTDSADNVVVGSGISGLLVARELVAAGEEVTVLERGGARLDADLLPLTMREEQAATTEHNTEPAEGGEEPWQYAYAFGGSSLLWSGVMPRLLPADFEMRSRYGLWRDWPIGYDDLLPFYQEAERALSVAGGEHEAFPGSDAYPLPAPEPSAVDRLVGPLLEPFGPLPVARPGVNQNGYPPPPTSVAGGIELSFSMLAVARELTGAPGFSVRGQTAAARLRREGDRIAAIECIGADGSRSEVGAKRVIVAAHGIENAALLLRSGLDEGPVGRWLGDHIHAVLEVEIDRPIEEWSASSRDSGISYAWADGEWRSKIASAVAIPFNPGLLLRDAMVDALAAGTRGERLRTQMADRFARTIVLYVSLEDAPREDRRVELSARRDSLGLPRTRVSYPADSEYVLRGLKQVCDGLEERLRPLGARIVGQRRGGHGGHMLGTCFMGPDGVVDENLRHRHVSNLYVAGGSAFPTHSALHPTATIAALAVRLGRHLLASP